MRIVFFYWLTVGQQSTTMMSHQLQQRQTNTGPDIQNLPITPTSRLAPSPHCEATASAISHHHPGLCTQPQECTCLACAEIGISPGGSQPSEKPVHCRVLNYPVGDDCVYGPNERFLIYYFRNFVYHERSHFGRSDAYRCPEEHCSVTSKTWADLRRHTKNIHCKKPIKFSCHVPWCKRSGDDGFTRMDKLRDHVRNVHEGKVMPGRANRAIRPAV